MSPFARKNGPSRTLSDFDDSLLVQSTLDKPGVSLNELQQELEQVSVGFLLTGLQFVGHLRD